MARYRQTFRRHRLMYTLPIMISIAVAAWFAFGAPRAYRSTTSLWIDNGPVLGSSLDSLSANAAAAYNGELTTMYGPAPIERLTLRDDLAAPAFDLAVGDDSLLLPYLKSGIRDGFSPSVLLKHGTPTIPYQIARAIGTGVRSSVAGPEVLHLSYDGPTPAVARSVLTSVVAHLKSNSAIYGNDFATTEHLYFQQTAAAASTALTSAAAAASTYKREHPDATVQSDPFYASLEADLKKTRSAASTASAALASTKQGGAGLNAVIREIDPPSLPTSPTVGRMQIALSLLGGLLAGVLMSVMTVVLCTPPSRPWDAELSTAPWMKLRWDRREFAAARREHARRAAHRRRRRSVALPLGRRSA